MGHAKRAGMWPRTVTALPLGIAPRVPPLAEATVVGVRRRL